MKDCFLAIDYGTKRVGLAYADELKVALPLAALKPKNNAELFESLAKIIQEKKITQCIVGYPLRRDGSPGTLTEEIDRFIDKLKEESRLPVHKVNEELSSVQAESDLKAFGITKTKRSIKSHQKYRESGDIDSRAAAIILQEYLDSHL